MSDEIKTLKDAEKATVETEEGQRSGKGRVVWMPGLALIAVGALFLLNNLFGFHVNNWWAIFIFIPAFGALGYAIDNARTTGRFGQEARGSLIGGIAILFVALAFLLNWNWGAIWPFFLVLAGLAALLTATSD